MARTAVALAAVLLFVHAAQARVWTDASGKYTFEADLIAFNETDLVLQKADKTLVAVDMEQLSAEDQKYVQSKEAAEAVDKLHAKKQIWKMRSGLEVIGNVVDYVRKDVTFSMTRGKIYVNDQLFENLTGIQQKVVPLIAAHFTERDITDRAGLFDWLRRRRGEPITFTVEGVQMELENGDLYGVPFFMFSDQALAALKPGWEQWAAKTATFDQQQESELRLQTEAQSFSEGQAQTNQLLKMQLQMQAFQAGLLWEVMLYPAPGTSGWPLYVVVPGRDSRQAGWNALANNPGYVLGPIARVSPRF
jgi:hypothetical protein